MRRAPTAISLVTSVALLAAIACGGPPPTGAGSPVVDEVIDGDTIVVRAGDTTETVRLLGVDTPETKHPTKPVECFGAEASAFTRSVLPPGTPVRLERDDEPRDAYGRLLAYVHRTDGVFVNRELVARGYAAVLVIAPNDAHADELRAAERSARADRRGLWGACGGPGRPVG